MLNVPQMKNVIKYPQDATFRRDSRRRFPLPGSFWHRLQPEIDTTYLILLLCLRRRSLSSSSSSSSSSCTLGGCQHHVLVSATPQATDTKKATWPQRKRVLQLDDYMVCTSCKRLPTRNRSTANGFERIIHVIHVSI